MRSTFFVKKVEPKSFPRIYFKADTSKKYYFFVTACFREKGGAKKLPTNIF